MTEAFHMERRPPLDDGASAETVERITRRFIERADALFGPGCFGSVGYHFGRHWDKGRWHISINGPWGRQIASASGADLEEAMADAEMQSRARPTEQKLAATLGLSEVPAND